MQEINYTDLGNFFFVVFELEGVPFYSLVDKEDGFPFLIKTLSKGKIHEEPYDEEKNLSEMQCFQKDYFEVIDAFQEFFGGLNG